MVIYLSSFLLLFTIFWMGFLVIIFLFLLFSFIFSIFKNPIHFTLLKIIIFLFVSLGFLSRFLRFLSMLFAPQGP